MTPPRVLLVGHLDDDVVMPGIHKGQEVSTLNAPVPLCWYAEGQQRGATDEEWAVAVDHETLPAFYVTEGPDGDDVVTCRECREWMHA